MIKVVKVEKNVLVTIKSLSLGVTVLDPGLCSCIKSYKSLNVFFFEMACQFHQISHGAFCRSGTNNVLTGFALLNKLAATLVYG